MILREVCRNPSARLWALAMATIANPLDSLPLGRRELIVLLAMMMSLNALSIDAMLPALDNIAADLGVLDGNDRQLVIAVYGMGMGLGCLLPGSLADRFGRRRIVLFSLVIYTVFSAITAFLQDFTLLLIARAIAGILGAGLLVAPIAIVRDLYDGDEMAKLMSLISAVFITVPVLAPSLGQGILLFGDWRLIFIILAVIGALTGIWTYARLPETLAPERRQMVNVPVIARNMRVAMSDRSAAGYVIGGALLMGGVFGYVNSAQQLYQDHFGVGDQFPLLFGMTAAVMVLSNLTNSAIVTRFGARRVSHTGVLVFIVVSAVQVWSSYAHPGDIWWFMPLMAINLGLLGFLGANFGSIAMQPFAQIAGSASSIQTFVRMFGAASAGAVIGSFYDGTALPFAWSLLISSLIALVLVLYSEKGKLFRRLHQVPTKERCVP